MIRVHKHAPPPAADLLDRARRIAPVTIGHLREIGFVDTGIVPLVTPVSVVGPALTVRMVAPDGGAVHMAIDTTHALPPRNSRSTKRASAPVSRRVNRWSRSSERCLVEPQGGNR